jgi:hypothetical protein
MGSSRELIATMLPMLSTALLLNFSDKHQRNTYES